MSNLTIKDIAKLCGVGTSTVSRAMNDDPGINKETKARILRMIEEHNYVPNNSARNLKMAESNTIALLIRGINNQFFQGMMQIFEQELNKIEYSFIIQAVNEEQDEVAVAAELIKEKKLKGIIFLGGNMERSKEILAPIGIPYVRCTGATEPNKNPWGGCSITIDDAQESFKAVDYLVKKGHKKIAIFTPSVHDRSAGRLRLEGYKMALEKNGIKVSPDLIFHAKHVDEAYSAATGYELAKELLAKNTDCTAIYAVSDMMAMGVYKAIQEAGKRIPEDYSVLGFDGLELTQYLYPTLTTVKQPIEPMVLASIEQLMKAIDGQETPKQVFYDATMLEGQSVRTIP